MEAALITGMFNVGFNFTREPTKDVFTTTDNDFKDVLSKKMESERNKDVNKNDVKKLDVEEEKVDVKKKDKNKKDDKKVTDDNEDKTEKINGLIEKKLENVEENADKLKELELIGEDVINIQDELKNGLMQNVDEVGPQSVETEKITLDKFEMLEEKLDKLSDLLGMSDDKGSLEDGAELSQDAESGSESDSTFMSSVETDVLQGKDVKGKDVKNRDEKFTIKDFRKESTLENNVEQLELDVNSLDNEIPRFDIANTTNVMMNRAEKLQEQIDVLKQITEKVSVNILEDKSEMLIKLKPDNLGKVTMQIAVENGNVTAKFLAESDRVKEILESNMQELKDHLAKQGMTVQDLSVSVGNENREREVFGQSNFRSFRRSRSVEKITNSTYLSGSGIFEENDVNLANYWPDSTVSFSA